MIDSHHHIWMRRDLPWLMGPEQPRIFGSYGSIRRDYPIREYLDDVAGTGIEKSVYVQANWDPARFEDEVRWVQSVADSCGWPHGIVGFADFTREDVGPQLKALSRYPLMRGVRQQFHWHEIPSYRFAPRPDLAADAGVRRNISRLADHGWCFDLQVFASQMPGAAELAAECSDVVFILQHAGMLEDLSHEGRELWISGMKRLAERPNVVSKLSGFGTFLHRNDSDFVEEMIVETVAIFGADRCMFGSNFPIEKIWTSLPELVETFRARSAHLDEHERNAVFRDTAARVYRI